MADYVVWVCPSDGAHVAELELGRERPTCTAGHGQFVTISQAPAFDVSQLTVEDALLPWGAGFTVMATGLVVVQACKALLRALK